MRDYDQSLPEVQLVNRAIGRESSAPPPGCVHDDIWREIGGSRARGEPHERSITYTRACNSCGDDSASLRATVSLH